MRTAKHYYHQQESASTAWVIVHNLGRLPIVDITIDEYATTSKILPLAIEHNSINSLTVTFSEAQTGTANLR